MVNGFFELTRDSSVLRPQPDFKVYPTPDSLAFLAPKLDPLGLELMSVSTITPYHIAYYNTIRWIQQKQSLYLSHFLP